MCPRPADRRKSVLESRVLGPACGGARAFSHPGPGFHTCWYRRACPAKGTTVLPYLWPPGEAHCEQGPGSSRQRWVAALPNCSCFRPFQVPPSHRPQHSLINEWPSSWASCIEAPRRLANLSRLSSSLPSAIVELIEPRLQLTSTAIHPGRNDYLLSLDTQS